MEPPYSEEEIFHTVHQYDSRGAFLDQSVVVQVDLQQLLAATATRIGWALNLDSNFPYDRITPQATTNHSPFPKELVSMREGNRAIGTNTAHYDHMVAAPVETPLSLSSTEVASIQIFFRVLIRRC